MRGQVLIAGAVILIICGGLATADYVLSERPHQIAMELQNGTLPSELSVSSSSSSLSSSFSSSLSVNSSSAETMRTENSQRSHSGVVMKGVSTKKAAGINVADVFLRLQLIAKPTNEASFLLLTAPDKSAVQTVVLLRSNDRAFLLSWIESDTVKQIFASLKQALQEQFSGKVTELVDETRSQENGPPVDYLSFMDPALSPERIIFLRVRTRLYEIHVAENGRELTEQLVTELSK